MTLARQWVDRLAFWLCTLPDRIIGEIEVSLLSVADPTALPAHVLAAEIAAHRLSPVDVIDATIAKIKAHNPKLHSFTETSFEDARLAAEAADKAIRFGHAVGPLFKELSQILPFNLDRTVRDQHFFDHCTFRSFFLFRQGHEAPAKPGKPLDGTGKSQPLGIGTMAARMLIWDSPKFKCRQWK